jgi:hypothetical protein
MKKIIVLLAVLMSMLVLYWSDDFEEHKLQKKLEKTRAHKTLYVRRHFKNKLGKMKVRV